MTSLHSFIVKFLWIVRVFYSEHISIERKPHNLALSGFKTMRRDLEANAASAMSILLLALSQQNYAVHTHPLKTREALRRRPFVDMDARAVEVENLSKFICVVQDLWKSLEAPAANELPENILRPLKGVNDNAYVAPSSRHGLGLFANRDLKKDEIVTFYPVHALGSNSAGRSFTEVDAEYFRNAGVSEYRTNLLHHSVGKDIQIDVNPQRVDEKGWLGHRANDAACCKTASPGAILQYLQQSLEESNCIIVPFGNAAPIMALATKRAVSKDEELLFCYGPYHWLEIACNMSKDEAMAIPLTNEALPELLFEYSKTLARACNYTAGSALWRILQPFQESVALDFIEEIARDKCGFTNWPASRELAGGVKLKKELGKGFGNGAASARLVTNAQKKKKRTKK